MGVADSSDLGGKSITRKGGARFVVNWRARLFMTDKVIHPATITSAYKSGFALQFHQAVPLGTEMNLEFSVDFRGEAQRIRIKAKVGYCLLRSNGDGVDMDVVTSQISREDHHLMGNILQVLTESKEFNLRG